MLRQSFHKFSLILKRKMGAIIQPLSAGCSWAGGWRNRAAAFLAT
jgi:hypothetical protein